LKKWRRDWKVALIEEANLDWHDLERVRFELNHDRALSFCFDAFSSREPVSTSLENAPTLSRDKHRSDYGSRLALRLAGTTAQCIEAHCVMNNLNRTAVGLTSSRMFPT
jgi:hypothetical protein